MSPQQVQEIAMRFGVDIATAAMILAHALSGEPQPQAATAGGGHAQAGEPVLVGERGLEIIVPRATSDVLPIPTDEQLARSLALRDQPGVYYEPYNPRLQPRWGTGWKGLPVEVVNELLKHSYAAGVGDLGAAVKPEPWDRWLATRPESQNIEDRRDPESVDWDEMKWRQRYSQKRVSPPLKQFPPAPEAKPSLPDWLKDQESQWVKSKR